MESSIIQSIFFKNLVNWDVRYLKIVIFDYKGKPVVKLRDVLKRSKIPVTIQDGVCYKRVMVKLDNGGVFWWNTNDGKDILKNQDGIHRMFIETQFLVKAGQFLVSRIAAMQGVFGIVSQELDGAIVNNNFLAFDVDNTKVSPHFLPLLLNTKYFLALLQKKSVGFIQGHIEEEDFLDILIPLLDLKEQDAIVNKMEHANRLMEEAEKIKQKVVKECEEAVFS